MGHFIFPLHQTTSLTPN